LETYNKVLRKAEGIFVHALKTTVPNPKSGGVQQGRKSAKTTTTVSTGICCLVVEQFCVNLDYRVAGKAHRKRPAKRAANKGGARRCCLGLAEIQTDLHAACRRSWQEGKEGRLNKDGAYLLSVCFSMRIACMAEHMLRSSGSLTLICC
jgi:hypothetical protein